jgi:uncharacterized membrane protein
MARVDLQRTAEDDIMNRAHALETRAIFAGAGARRRHKRGDFFVRASQACLAASVTLSSINSPAATVLGALLFALLAGWLKARTSPAARALVALAPAYIWLYVRLLDGWRAGVARATPHTAAAGAVAAASPAMADAAAPAMLRATGRSCKVGSWACLPNRRQSSVDAETARGVLWSRRAL